MSVTKLTAILSTNEKLSVSWQVFFFSPETHGVNNYGSGWRKHVVNHLLETGSNGARAHIQVLLLRKRRSALRQLHFQLHKHVSLEPVSGTYR